MHTIKAKFEVSSPMLLHGAEQHDSDNDNPVAPNNFDLRPPSIKGALRFWWRTTYYPSLCEKNNEKEALKELHSKETRLFGGMTNSKSDSGEQSCILLKVRNQQNPNQASFVNKVTTLNSYGIKYILGPGFSTNANAIQPKVTFELEIRIKKLIEKDNEHFEDDLKSIVTAVKAFGLLGSLGSRARKGFGSVSVLSIDAFGKSENIPKDVDEYKESIIELLKLGNGLTELPPFSCFSENSGVFLVKERSQKPDAVLNLIGRKQIIFRSEGHKRNGNHIVGTGDKAVYSKKNFHEDRMSVANARKNGSLPKYDRAIFGLPIPTGKQDRISAIDKVKNKESDDSRRASPLFIHIHKIGEYYYGICLILGAKFVTNDKKLAYIKGNQVFPIHKDPDYKVLLDFLDYQDVAETVNHERIQLLPYSAIYEGSALKALRTQKPGGDR